MAGTPGARAAGAGAVRQAAGAGAVRQAAEAGAVRQAAGGGGERGATGQFGRLRGCCSTAGAGQWQARISGVPWPSRRGPAAVIRLHA